MHGKELRLGNYNFDGRVSGRVTLRVGISLFVAATGESLDWAHEMPV